MRQSHLILSNAAVMWVTRALLVIPQLILVPYLLATIGEAGFGTYALLWALFQAIDQLEKALQSGIVKHGAAMLAQGHVGAVNRLVSSSSAYSILLAALGFLAVMIVGSLYSDPTGHVGSSFLVIAVGIVLLFPMTPYIGIIQSRQRYYIGAIADTISRYLGLVLVIIWFQAVRPSVEALVIVMMLMLVLSRMAQIPFAYRLVHGLQNSLALFDWTSFWLTLRFGLATALIALCLVVNDTGVRWLMGALASPVFVAHLAIMLMPAMLMFQVVSPVTMISMPAASAYEAVNNRTALRELLVRGMRYTTILILGGLLSAGLLITAVLDWWIGTEYTFLSPYAFGLLASSSVMWSTSVAHHMLRGLGRLRTVLLIYLVALIVAPIAILLVVWTLWQNAYIAVTVSLSVGYILCAALNVIYCLKHVRAGPWDVVVRAFGQPLLIALPFAVVALAIYTATLQHSIGLLFAALVLSSLYFASCYFFIATSAEREQIIELARILRRKIVSERGGSSPH